MSEILMSNGISMTRTSIIMVFVNTITGCCHLKIITFQFHSCCVDFCLFGSTYFPNSTLKIQLNSNLLLMDTRVIANLLLMNLANIFSRFLSLPDISWLDLHLERLKHL